MIFQCEKPSSLNYRVDVQTLTVLRYLGHLGFMVQMYRVECLHLLNYKVRLCLTDVKVYNFKYNEKLWWND